MKTLFVFNSKEKSFPERSNSLRFHSKLSSQIKYFFRLSFLLKWNIVLNKFRFHWIRDKNLISIKSLDFWAQREANLRSEERIPRRLILNIFHVNYCWSQCSTENTFRVNEPRLETYETPLKEIGCTGSAPARRIALAQAEGGLTVVVVAVEEDRAEHWSEHWADR